MTHTIEQIEPSPPDKLVIAPNMWLSRPHPIDSTTNYAVILGDGHPNWTAHDPVDGIPWYAPSTQARLTAKLIEHGWTPLAPGTKLTITI